MATKKQPIDTDYLTEHHDLYDVPLFNENDRDYFFTLNESELHEVERLRLIPNKAYFILLLGYFKAKPVTLTLTWGIVKNDLSYIYLKYFPNTKIPRKNLHKDAKSVMYKKVFSLTGFRRFSENDENKLLEQAKLAVFNRADSKNVFDTCVNYLNQQWIALPALYRLQKVVRQSLKQEDDRLFVIFKRELKGDIKKYIVSLLAPQRTTDEFNTLRQQAKDFTFGELSRELQDKKN